MMLIISSLVLYLYRDDVYAMEDLKEGVRVGSKGCEVCRRSRNGGTVGEWTTKNNGRAEQDRKKSTT